MFQSTRPRGARQHVVRRVDDLRFVSIHAPARGATAAVARCATGRPGFNPRARAGRDGASLPLFTR